MLINLIHNLRSAVSERSAIMHSCLLCLPLLNHGQTTPGCYKVTVLYCCGACVPDMLLHNIQTNMISWRSIFPLNELSLYVTVIATAVSEHETRDDWLRVNLLVATPFYLYSTSASACEPKHQVHLEKPTQSVHPRAYS